MSIDKENQTNQKGIIKMQELWQYKQEKEAALNKASVFEGDSTVLIAGVFFAILLVIMFFI